MIAGIVASIHVIEECIQRLSLPLSAQAFKKTRFAEQYSVIESNEDFLIYKSIWPIVPFYSPQAKILSQERAVN